MTPTRRLALLLVAVGLCGLLLPSYAVVVLLLAVLGTGAVDALAVRDAPHVERLVPRLLSRGVPEPLLLRAAPAADLHQPLPPGLRLVDGALVAVRRGRHVLPPVVVRRTGPLGLGGWVHRVGGEAAVTVYPDLPTARRLARQVRGRSGVLMGQSLRGPIGAGTDFEALRDYLPDDDVRSVNWRATARRGRPTSNTYRVERARDVVLAVDCGRLMAAPLAPDVSRLDRAVDAVAALALVADALGDRVSLLAYDAVARRRLPPRTGAGDQVLRAVHDLEPELVDTDHDLLVEAVGRTRRCAVLLCTDLLDAPSARGLVEAVRSLSVRHVVSVVVPVDTDLRRLLTTEPATTQEVAVLAAAVELSTSRTRAVADLRAAGARVVEAPSDQLVGAAARAYLSAGASVRA